MFQIEILPELKCIIALSISKLGVNLTWVPSWTWLWPL